MHQEFALLEKPSFLIQNSMATEVYDGSQTSDYVRWLGTKSLSKGLKQQSTGSVKEIVIVAEPS